MVEIYICLSVNLCDLVQRMSLFFEGDCLFCYYQEEEDQEDALTEKRQPINYLGKKHIFKRNNQFSCPIVGSEQYYRVSMRLRYTFKMIFYKKRLACKWTRR